MEKEMKFCQSCGMPLTDEVLGTNADGSKNEEYCMYCYRDGKFLQECTMDEMIEHCAQFIRAVNEGLEKPITKEEYIGMMKTYFPQLKRWRKTLNVSNDEVVNVNPALAGIKELIAQMADKQPIAFISSVDQEGFPWSKAMLKPRKREGIKTFYFTTNTFSIRVAQYKANPKASIYFCDAKGFKGMMLRGTMEVLTDAKSKEMIWRKGDEQYYPEGVTDPNYCVLKFTATDGRFYSDFYPRSFKFALMAGVNAHRIKDRVHGHVGKSLLFVQRNAELFEGGQEFRVNIFNLFVALLSLRGGVVDNVLQVYGGKAQLAPIGLLHGLEFFIRFQSEIEHELRFAAELGGSPDDIFVQALFEGLVFDIRDKSVLVVFAHIMLVFKFRCKYRKISPFRPF